MFVLLQALYIFKFKCGCVINIITLYYIFFVWNIYFLWVCLKCIHSVITGTLTSITKMLNQVATSPAVQVFFRNPELIFLSARDAWLAFPRHSIFYIYFYDYDLPIALFEEVISAKFYLSANSFIEIKSSLYTLQQDTPAYPLVISYKPMPSWHNKVK